MYKLSFRRGIWTYDRPDDPKAIARVKQLIELYGAKSVTVNCDRRSTAAILRSNLLSTKLA